MPERLSYLDKPLSESEMEAVQKDPYKFLKERQEKLEALVDKPVMDLYSEHGITVRAGRYQCTGDTINRDFSFMIEAPVLLEFTNILGEGVRGKLADVLPKGPSAQASFEKAYYAITPDEIAGDTRYRVQATQLDYPVSFVANILVMLQKEMFMEEILHLKIGGYIDEDGIPRSPSHDIIDELMQRYKFGKAFSIPSEVLEEKREIENIFKKFDRELGTLITQ